MKLVFLCLTGVIGSCPFVSFAAAAAKAAFNRLYVQSMQGGGVFYARCIPAEQTGTAGFTDIYRVRREGDERVDHYDWYSPQGLVLGWSPIAGQVAVMARRREPAATPDQQVELGFYLGGRHLKSWTTAELQALGATVAAIREDNPPGKFAEFQLLGCEQIDNSNEYVFTVQFSGRKKAAFDILTGNVYRPPKLTRTEAAELANAVARQKGIPLEDYVLSNSQFDARTGLWRLFYVHKPPGMPGGHFTIDVNDETKATRFHGGR